MLSILDFATLSQPAKTNWRSGYVATRVKKSVRLRSIWRSGDMHVIAFRRRSFQRPYNHKANWFEPENGINKIAAPTASRHE